MQIASTIRRQAHDVLHLIRSRMYVIKRGIYLFIYFHILKKYNCGALTLCMQCLGIDKNFPMFMASVCTVNIVLCLVQKYIGKIQKAIYCQDLMQQLDLHSFRNAIEMNS